MIYAQIGNSLAMYQGMSQETIAAMLTAQNITFTFISEEVYKQKLADYPIQPAPLACIIAVGDKWQPAVIESLKPS